MPGGNIPDHGDLVQLPWTVDAAEADRLTMSVDGRCFPFRFERTIVLDGARICCDYRLKNLGDTPFPWLWCAHPLVPLAPGMTLETDAEFEVLFAMGAAEGLFDRCVRWNELPSLENNWAAKLFSQRGAVDSVIVRRADGSGLRFEWDAADVPFLGLWVNNGAWSGCGSEPYFNMGIEPAMVPVDDLSAAENPPVLPAGQTVEWSLKIIVAESKR